MLTLREKGKMEAWVFAASCDFDWEICACEVEKHEDLLSEFFLRECGEKERSYIAELISICDCLADEVNSIEEMEGYWTYL